MNKIRKIVLTIATCSFVILVNISSVNAEEKIIKQTQTHNVFKGALLSIWSKFRSFNPHSNQNATAKTVYTAGIRGAESTGTLIQPQGKEDLTQDEAFQKELKLFGNAMTQLDNGDLQKAASSLAAFLEHYAQSALRPNALFAQGISYAGLGDTQKSQRSLQEFIASYPNHPLVADAKQLIQQLN